MGKSQIVLEPVKMSPEIMDMLEEKVGGWNA